ncbi:MAG: hypothetical protein LBP61_05680 [Desulfovibrio sp.]|jgi:hypothetical protein|nr:hypothetical protein [Desulfovibrio sp.]
MNFAGKERLRQEAAAAISGLPGLKAQAELAGGADRYVEDWLHILECYALRMAAASGRSPEETFRRVTLDSLHMAGLQADANVEAEMALFQLDADVDLDAFVTVIRTAPRFARQNPFVLRKRFPEDVRDEVLTAFKKGVVNEDTGLTVGMSGNDFREHLFTGESVDASAHLEAIGSLPELMRTARLIEKYDDKKPSERHEIEKMRRFIAAFSDGSGDYAVLLTVKEYAPGKYTLDEKNPVRLYHHRVERKLVPASSAAALVEQDGTSTSSSTNKYTIRQLLEDVNDSEGNPYLSRILNQSRAQANSPLGSVTISSAGYLIRLFQGANLSTLLHESGHIFFEEMGRAVGLGLADKAMRRDHAILRDWLGAKEGERLSVGQKEQLAKDFESYLMEGKAPSKELEGGFSRFRKWLLAVYRTIPNPRRELTDEVRGVFGRMLAVERKIVRDAALEEILAMPLEDAKDISARMIDQLEAGAAPWQRPCPPEKERPVLPWDPLEKAESLLAASGVAVFHDQKTRAYYSQDPDSLHLPPKEAFEDSGAYYSAALRGLAHSTRSPERLSREGGPYGSKKYALEELRAEIAAWMVCEDIGLAYVPDDYAARAESWINALKDDPRTILRVFQDAEEIAGYVLGAAPRPLEPQALLNGIFRAAAPPAREGDAPVLVRAEELAIPAPQKRGRGWSR